jgi:MarR family 2-MHQ and catechol resistance regulon transcriptional repressor
MDNPTKTFIRFVKHLKNVLEGQEELFEQETGFKYNEVAILDYLLKEGQQPITQTALKFNIMPSQMTFVVDRMEIAGYVNRVRMPENRRTIYLRATNKAMDLVKGYEESYTKILDNVMSNLNAKEKATVLELLDKISEKK